MGEEGVDEGGPVLDALESVLDDGRQLVHVVGDIAQGVSSSGPIIQAGRS
jgi:hypothetical protein